ncbi:MAG: hypothetical protein U0625_02950 [Phycisphaerales bacterium]
MTEPIDPHSAAGAPGPRDPLGADSLHETLSWVLRSIDAPAQAAGDWIAYEVDESRASAIALLTDPTAPLSRIRRARVLYSALRAEGETAEERTIGSRLAIAAAAAALLFHGERISNHDDAALAAAFRSVVTDAGTAPEIRFMVQMAEKKLAFRG